MELKKFMERQNISKEYIAKAAKILNDICRRCACEDCPLHLDFVCALTTGADVPIEECVRESVDSYLKNNEATPPDMVNKPAHYVKGNMECIDFIKAIVSDLTPYEAYCLGNVVKYLWRFKDKNGVVDLDKAVRYIEFLKEAQRNGEQ